MAPPRVSAFCLDEHPYKVDAVVCSFKIDRFI